MQLTDQRIEEIICETADAWNAQADTKNQWPDLGRDEKDLLIAGAIEAELLASRSAGAQEQQGAAERVCGTCSDSDCLADNAGLSCPFSVALRSIDEHDPQSFINGVKWAREHTAHNSGAQEPVAAQMVYFKRTGSAEEDCLPVLPGRATHHVNEKLITRIVDLCVAHPRPMTDAARDALASLRRKIVAACQRNLEVAPHVYKAWMLKGDALDLIDAEIEREGGKS